MRPSGPSLIQVLAERAPLCHGPGQGARIARAHLRAYQPQAETLALPDPPDPPTGGSDLAGLQRPGPSTGPFRRRRSSGPGTTEFTNVARDVTRKRSERFIPIKVDAAHVKLQ